MERSIIDICTIVALLLGPVAAVIVSEHNDRRRERRNAQIAIFTTLMMTRAERVNVDHVRALNAISLQFNGIDDLSRAVREKWNYYLDHLGTPTSEPNWVQRGNDLFIDMLEAMAKHLGYRYDRVELLRGSYSPAVYGNQNQEWDEIRRLLAAWLRGEIALKVENGSITTPAIVLSAKDKLAKAKVTAEQ